MARARLASSRTFDGHERCRFSGEWRRFRTIIQSHCRHARRLERRPPARRALRFSEKCAGSEIGAPRLPAESSQCAKAPTALPPAGGGAIRFGASKKIRLIIFRTFRFMVCPGCGTFLQRGSSPPPPWRPQPGCPYSPATRGDVATVVAVTYLVCGATVFGAAAVPLDAGSEYVTVHPLPGFGATRPPEPEARTRTMAAATVTQTAMMMALRFILAE